MPHWQKSHACYAPAAGIPQLTHSPKLLIYVACQRVALIVALGVLAQVHKGVEGRQALETGVHHGVTHAVVPAGRSACRWMDLTRISMADHGLDES
eukprot:scaffold229965_cov19-Tisochrysis_lutea.AAC.1